MADETHRQPPSKKLATEPQRERRESTPSRSAPKSKPAPPRRSAPEVVASGSSQLPSTESSGAKWFWAFVGLGVMIWLFNAAKENGSRSSGSRSYTPPSSSSTYTASPAPKTPRTVLEFSKPPVGQNNILSMPQIRWCLREDIRVQALRPLTTSNQEIDQFNAVVSDYNRRCGSFRYRQGTLERARREVEAVRAEIVAATIQESPTQLGGSSGTRSAETRKVMPPPSVPSVQRRPSHQRSEVVFQIQSLLKQLGYNPGPADGIYGVKTKAAIEAYERDHGRPVSGDATAELLGWLRVGLARAAGQATVEREAPLTFSDSRPNESERKAIENTCGWRRNSNGSADYRRCVENEEAQLRAVGQRPNLAGIAPDDRNSIENTCGWRKDSNGPDDYYKCISQSLVALNDIGERPNLSNLSSLERVSIENTCGWHKNSNGPADYYQCVQNQVAQLAGASRQQDLSTLSGLERTAIENTCGWRKNSNGPADYYRCVENQRSDLAMMLWRPNFTNISNAGRRAIESTCGWRRNSNGPADYYRCVQQQFRALR